MNKQGNDYIEDGSSDELIRQFNKRGKGSQPSAAITPGNTRAKFRSVTGIKLPPAPRTRKVRMP